MVYHSDEEYKVSRPQRLETYRPTLGTIVEGTMYSGLKLQRGRTRHGELNLSCNGDP